MDKSSIDSKIWAKCSSCKAKIEFAASYYECSVSTCTARRTGYVFCSLSCWEVHLPGARHKDASAIEERAPRSGATRFEANPAPAPRKRIIPAKTNNLEGVNCSEQGSREVLIVASKLKTYVNQFAGMNTSANVLQALSDIVRRETKKAIQVANSEGRKTLMDRDFK